MISRASVLPWPVRDMKIATWNVNGIRARQGATARLARRRKARHRLPAGNQGVARSAAVRAARRRRLLELLARREGLLGRRAAGREVAGRRPAGVLASGIRFRAAHRVRDGALTRRRRDDRVGLRAERRQGLRREDALPAGARSYVADAERDGKLIDSVRRSERRARRARHPSEAAKPNQIGARPEERALLARIISRGLVDVHRSFEPDNDNLFTWWAPWRNHERAQHRLADRLRAGVEGARRSREVSGRAAGDRQQRSRSGGG